MKIRNITILTKGENKLRQMSRKEFIDYIDNDVIEGTEIEIVKIDY